MAVATAGSVAVSYRQIPGPTAQISVLLSPCSSALGDFAGALLSILIVAIEHFSIEIITDAQEVAKVIQRGPCDFYRLPQ